jgi:excisionase family DNA binding protein
MTDKRPPEPADPWLTLAEIADELRVNPATVRLWVSQGKLGATRAGRRKLLVRRSELTRMLEASKRQQSKAEAVPPHPRMIAPLRPVRLRMWSAGKVARANVDPEEVRSAVLGMQQAAAAWDAAIDASENAPPDPAFVARLRAIAQASSQQAEAMERAARIPGFVWTPLPETDEMILSHELRPGGNRPGPRHLWQSFDMTVERLSIAMQGKMIDLVQHEYAELSRVLSAIADSLDQAQPNADANTDLRSETGS